MDTLTLSLIAHIHTPFAEKFGVPRQSGLVPTAGRIVFAPEYRNPDALRGLEGFSHPVSYTHLDVYKRQGRNSFPPAFY